jgi:CoA:oxalate CoA-transferase
MTARRPPPGHDFKDFRVPQPSTVSPAPGPLAGLVVVDLTRVLAGPYCTMVLSDLGARIIKVETPGTGDDSRHIGPFLKGKSAYFMSLNRGKESIALDLKAAGDRATFERLLAKADVLVENYRPGTMEKLGFGYETLRQRWPRLIYAQASGFGDSGPYRSRAAYDMVVQAMGGIMSITGHPGAPPTRVGTSVGDITAGLFTAIGINAALYHREKTGEGQKIDVAMLDCQIAILENAIARYFATGETPGPLGARHPSITPFEAFATSDGHMVIAAGNDGLFRKLCEALQASDIAQDARFTNNDLRCSNQPALKDAIEQVLATRPTADWLAVLDGAGIPCGPINNVEQALNDRQVRARNMVVSVADKDVGSLNMAGNPIKLSGFADPATRGRVPDLDEDRAAILQFIGG